VTPKKAYDATYFWRFFCDTFQTETVSKLVALISNFFLEIKRLDFRIFHCRAFLPTCFFLEIRYVLARFHMFVRNFELEIKHYFRYGWCRNMWYFLIESQENCDCELTAAGLDAEIPYIRQFTTYFPVVFLWR